MPTIKTSAASLFLIVALAIGGCNSAAPSGEDIPAAAAAVTMAVSGAVVTTRPIRSQRRLLGQTVARRHISLRAPAAGRVFGLNILTGDRVNRGEIVAHIVRREVEAAIAGLAVARQIDAGEAPGLARAVGRHLHNTGVPVIAPEDAIVAQRMVSSGQLVAEFDQLADLIDSRSVFVNAAVPVDDLAAICPGMQVVVSSPLHPGVNYSARVAGLSPSFNQAGATSAARIEFTGAQRIYEAGAPIEAAVTVKFVPDAIVIPAIALFEDAASDRYYVFVAGRDGRAHRTNVGVGIQSPTEVQITSGLGPGQVVITSGGYALSDGLQVKVTLARKEPERTARRQ